MAQALVQPETAVILGLQADVVCPSLTVRAACGLAGDGELEPAYAAPHGYSSALPWRDSVCPSSSARVNVPARQARAGEMKDHTSLPMTGLLS